MTLITNTLETVLKADSSGWTKGFNEANKSTAALQDTVRKFGAGTNNLVRSLTNVVNQNRTLGDVTRNLLNGFASINPVTALAAAGITAVGTAALGAANQAVALGNELNKVSQRTGVAVGALSTLKFAAEQSNASFGDVQAGLRTVARQATAAANGSKELQAAFKRVGVTVEDIRTKSPDELFRQIADGISGIKSTSEQSAVAAQLFGRQAGPNLVPLLAQGQAGIAALEAEARELGVQVSTGFARESGAFNDNLGKLKSLTQGFGLVIADELLPALNDALEAFLEIGKDALPKFVTFMEQAKFRTFQLATALNTAVAASIAFGANAVGNTKVAEEYNAVVAAGVEMLGLSKEEFEAEEEARRKSKETTKDQTKENKNLIETLTNLQALQKQFTESTNPQVTAIVGLAQSLEAMGTEGAEAFDKLIAKLEQFAAAGDKQAQLALDRLEKLKDAEVAAAQEILRAQLAEASALEEAADEARRNRAPFGQAGGQIGPAEAPREGEAGFIGPLSEGAFKRAGGELDPRETIDATASAIDKAIASQRILTEEAEKTNDAFEEGQQFMAGLTQLAGGFADALLATADGAKLAFQDFFKGLLKDLARAIVRATILQAILGLFGGGFSIAAIGKSVQSALGFGGQGFQDAADSSILGRTAQSRGLPGGITGNQALATPVAAAAGAPSFEVKIFEPGPFTRAEVTDKMIVPRLRERQRRLNEEPL